jgi:hypothetical protein
MKNDVRTVPSLINSLAELGVEEWGAKTYITGYRLAGQNV